MKNKAILICILLIIIIVIAILCVVIMNNINGYNYELLNNEDEVIMEAKPVEYLYTVMNNYRGLITRNVINKTYYNFAKNIVPKYKYLNLTDDNAKKYFENNKSSINKELGITSAEEFTNFCKLVNSLGSSELELERYRVYERSISDEGDYLRVYLGITYKGLSEVLFNSGVKMECKPDESALIFNANVNVDKVESWKKEEEENVEEYKKPVRGVPLDIAQ